MFQHVWKVSLAPSCIPTSSVLETFMPFGLHSLIQSEETVVTTYFFHCLKTLLLYILHIFQDSFRLLLWNLPILKDLEFFPRYSQNAYLHQE